MQTATTFLRDVDASARARLAPTRIAARQTGMTLLEIMIVLAILAAVMGLLIGPRVIDAHNRARIETTQMKLKKYAYEAYPSWAASHGVGCPASLAELNPYMN